MTENKNGRNHVRQTPKDRNMTEKNTKRRNAVIAAVAGAALLVGGSTYALWSAGGTFSDGTITAGDLNLSIDGPVGQYDVSADRTDSSSKPIKDKADGVVLTMKTAEAADVTNLNNTSGALSGHTVDLSTWRIVPGDTVAVVTPMTVTLKGDNLVAALTMDTTKLAEDLTSEGITYQYAVFDSTGAQLGETMSLVVGDEDESLALLQANGSGQTTGVDDTLDSTGVPTVNVDGTATVTLVVFGNFSSATTGRTYANTADALSDIPVTLAQVRQGTDQFAGQ